MKKRREYVIYYIKYIIINCISLAHLLLQME